MSIKVEIELEVEDCTDVEYNSLLSDIEIELKFRPEIISVHVGVGESE